MPYYSVRSKEDQKGNKETRKAFFPNLTNYINQSLLLTAWYDWLSKEVFARRGFYGANLYCAFISHINIFLQDVITALEIYESEAQSFFQIQFNPLFYMGIVQHLIIFFLKNSVEKWCMIFQGFWSLTKKNYKVCWHR